MLVKQMGPKTAFRVGSGGVTWHLLSIKVCLVFHEEFVGSPTPQREEEEEVITKF